MALFLLTRHAQSVLNVERRVNGDPALQVALTPAGEEAARRLGEQIANVPIELCVHTRFGRTRDTAALALAGRDIPFVEEPLLDDIKIGELEGLSVDDYDAWKAERTRGERFPGGGESLDEAAARYVQAYRALVARPEAVVLVVCHLISIRYALNATAGSASLDAPLDEIPNATPYVFDGAGLERAATAIERIVTLSA
ncbi:MAG: histidine phosphatase family protein [Gaiellaceae bacterium]